MTTPRDPDRLIHAFLLEGAEQLQDQVYDAVRAEIDQKRQRVVIGPWRVPPVSKLVPIGLGAAAVITVLFLGSQFIGSPTSNVGGPASEPPASAAPTEEVPSAEPTTAADGSLPEGPFVYEAGGDLPSITVDIPASGWSFDPQFQVLGKGEDVENLPEAAILLWSWPAGTGFNVYGDPCHWASTTPDTPATAVDDFAAALAAQPSRDSSDPVDVTIGGYPGKSLTLHVPEDIDFSTSSECDEDNFASYGIAGGTGPSRYHQGPGQIDQLWILDVDGATVVLDAMYRRDSRPELLDEMRRIAESATFQ
jgi:hypothetical protein